MKTSLLDIATVVATIVAMLVAIISLLFSLFVEKEKSSKFYSELLNRFRAMLGRFSNITSAIVYGVGIILNALLLFSLAYFILFAPIFLYEKLRQPNHAVSPTIDQDSIFYGLVIVMWCLSVITIRHKLTIDKLHDQIEYLNRIPGIKELKQNYNRQLFDAVIKQWNDFGSDLVTKHDDSPFAIDLADCYPLDVQDEILTIGCPNKAIHRRMNRKASLSSIGSDEEYEAWKRDKESIERLVKERFKVIQISYTLEKQITT
jgi:hypothetical protein